MEPKNEWVFFKEIDWNCPKNNRFNVDTRDFHCGYRWDDKEHKDMETIKKYPHFFFTTDELIDLLDRYYIESGGRHEWRYFSLIDYDRGWGLKYLRIYRTDMGFVVCDCEHRALKRDILNGEINKEFLHTH